MKVEIIKEVKIIPVFLIQAYDQQTPDGQLINSSLVEIIEDDPDRALAKAKKLFADRKFFRIHQYIEKEIVS